MKIVAVLAVTAAVALIVTMIIFERKQARTRKEEIAKKEEELAAREQEIVRLAIEEHSILSPDYLEQLIKADALNHPRGCTECYPITNGGKP